MAAELIDSQTSATTAGPVVVALCGSRAAESVRQAEADLTLAGKIVLTPFMLPYLVPTPMGQTERDRVAALDRAKIATADEVVVVNPERYLTDSAIDEITFALRLRRPLSFTEPVIAMGLRSELFDAALSGSKTIEIRRLDPKRLTLRPGEVIRFHSGQRSLLARAKTLRRSPSATALISGLDPSTVVPGADRDEMVKILEEIYPGLFDAEVPVIAIEINVLGELPAESPFQPLPTGCSITWHPGPPPADIPVTGAAGWLVDPVDGRVLVQQRDSIDGGRRFTLPGGRGEPVDGDDPLATLVRESIEESQVEIDAASAVYLGCQIVTGHPDHPEPSAKACFVVPISLYEPIAPDVDDPAGRTYRRFMTSISDAARLLGRGCAGRHEASAALVAARALGICVDTPTSADFRDDGDTVPVMSRCLG
ncbi:ASCH domain-containing protein [Catenulispora subtropica]|uniref:Nudix hydrolase domain-containing protein n=1 Tax=Catenulispora subtropica TaxID=450798 RepID=A0ABN2T8F0_9ACTN